MSINLGAFPLDSVMFEKYRSLFDTGKNAVIIFIPTLIMGRAVWNMINSRGTSEYWDIIKDTFTAILLLACFMSFLRVVLDLPDFFSRLFENNGTFALKTQDPEHSLLNDLVNYITIVTFWIGAAIYSIFLILVSAIAAYIIVFGTMTRSTWLVKAFFWVLILMSSWPLIWYLLNSAIRVLSQQDGFVNGILIIFFNILKAASPLLGAIAALKSPVASGAKAVAGGAGQVIGKTAQVTGAGVSKLGGQPIIDNFSAKTSVAKQAMNSTLGKTIPTMGAAAGLVGSAVGKSYRLFAPSRVQKGIDSTTAKIGSTFKNSKDMFTGQVLPGTSPASLAVKGVQKNISNKVESARVTASKPIVNSALSKSLKSADPTNLDSQVMQRELSKGIFQHQEFQKPSLTPKGLNTLRSNTQKPSPSMTNTQVSPKMTNETIKIAVQNTAQIKKQRIQTENNIGGRL